MNSPVELDGTEIRKLPFRHPDQEQTPGPPSIRVRRASKSSRDNTPLPELSLGSSSSNKAELSSFSRTARLETLEEALSQQTTPMVLDLQKVSTSPISTSGLLNPQEKRLPTLPNSPSSVLDAELRAIDARYQPLDMELLRSHFSDDTSGIASTVYYYESQSHSPQEKSRFSEWSTDTELVSPASMTSSSTFNVDSNSSPLLQTTNIENQYTLEAPISSVLASGPTTPVLGSEPEIILSPVELASDSPLLPSAAVVGSPQDVEFSSLLDDFEYDSNTNSFHESNPKRQGAILPFLRVVSPLSVSHPTENQLKRSSEDYSVQSAAMKELMEEIGYLGDMISSGL
jgi:hypothetical protein